MTNIEKLKKFITENNLEFNSGSGGDVNILALCGYACYIEASEEEIIQVVDSNYDDTDDEINNEIKRVFDYASTHNYAKWWNSETAKKQWKF